MSDLPTLYRRPTEAEIWADDPRWDETGMVPVERCNTCGGPIVTIRGRFVGSPDEDVCPTCLRDRVLDAVSGSMVDRPGADDE